jgi:small subunit ribosomal protein S27Ae
MKIAVEEGIEADMFQISYMGHFLANEELLAECGLQNESTLDVLLELLGGAKKKKKKAFTTPKKKAHKHKKVKLATLKFYKVDPSGKVDKNKIECDNCGVGSFMAEHANRYHCGKCGRAFTKETKGKEAKKGKKGKKE